MSNSHAQVAQVAAELSGNGPDLSQGAARFIRDRRLSGHASMRRVVVTGNLMAHCLTELADAMPEHERDQALTLLETWEAALQNLRAEVQS